MPGNIKCVFKQQTNKFEVGNQLKEEMDLLRSLNHNHIVSYHGFFLNDIIMEYCAGKDLFDLIITKNVQISLMKKHTIISQIADALVYLHSKNIIHGDIKTKNILLKYEYNPIELPIAKLCDFGLSKYDVGKTEVKGYTKIYAAPEIFQENQKVTKKSDVFSFGMAIYEIITQKIPFSDCNLNTVLRDGMIEKGIHPNFYNISKEICNQKLIDLMIRMCKIDPDERPDMHEVFTVIKEI